MFTATNQQHELSTIKSIQLCVLSHEQVKKMSAVEITDGTFYDSNGDPKLNSLFDPRMGVIERGPICKTCEQDYIFCPGHPGHINLARPIFNTQFGDRILKISKCICVRCSKLLINKDHPRIKNILKNTRATYASRFEKIFKLITANLKVSRCGTMDDNANPILNNHGCGAIQPSKYIDNLRQGYLTLEWYVENGSSETTAENNVYRQTMNPDLVLSLFRRISEEDALVLGFHKSWCLPHWMIMQSVLVVPPACRPSVRQYNGQRSEDDITHKYYDIVKYNNEVKEMMANPNPVPEEHLEYKTMTLQWHVSTLMNNEDNKNPAQSLTRAFRPIKGITERLKGKDGRIRNNLMGKRVDFSARSVISPDANIRISELGVPKEIAVNLTYPEIVCKYNINEMYKLIRNGNNTYPGAKSVKYAKTGRIRLLIDANLDEVVLEYGDVVNRHLRDGDYVLFNRQPSLHKMSMMGHRIRVMSGKTFRVNPNVVTPYNADFDGDEMNMHVPQCIQTGMELKYLTAVPNHFISPSTNKPIIKPSQDDLLGVFRLTADDVLLTQTDVLHLLGGTQAFKGVLPEPDVREGKYIRWTGKQIYSIILPPLSLISKPENERLKTVIIEDGILKQGQIETSSSGKVIMNIHSDFGHQETERYMNDLQLVTTKYLIKTGFSVGPSDLLLHPDIRNRNHKLIQDALNKEVDLAKKFHLNIIEDVTGNMADIYETNVNKIWTSLSDGITNSTMKNIDLQNRVYTMIASGAKGSDTNIKQMMCLLGQQTIDGARVPIGFTDRTLPHYPRYENGMESRGFISHSFLEGLNPKEFFFHAMAGREGLIDTAVKTANSGYLQRKLVKAMEDLKTYYDGSIRDNGGEIIEFVYGADGFNSSKIEQQNTEFKLINADKLFANYMFRESEDFTGYMTKKAIDNMKRKFPDWFKRLDVYNKSVQTCIDIYHVEMTKLVGGINDVKLYHPINFTKLISKATSVFKLHEITAKNSMNPVDILLCIEALIDKCTVGQQRNHVFATLVYDYLSPKRVLRDYKMTPEALDYVCVNAQLIFRKALVHAGDMVGPMAAQSIGERTTQMTLNSVDWETNMLFLKNGNGFETQIGEFIDKLMDKYTGTGRIKLIPENRTEYLELDNELDGQFKVPSTDEIGNVSWCDITAVTRHLPIGDLIEITTDSGRTVTATQQKSFLIWDFDTEKLMVKHGNKLVVGDCVAVTNNLPEPAAIITTIDLTKYFPKNQYIHGSEYHKAGYIYNTYSTGTDIESKLLCANIARMDGNSSVHISNLLLGINSASEIRHRFWAKNGIDFTLPYSKCDTFVSAWLDTSRRINTWLDASDIHTDIIDGYIYPAVTYKSCSIIPEHITLDAEFGFIVGIYLANGQCIDSELQIHNTNTVIRQRVIDWCTKLGLLYTNTNTGTSTIALYGNRDTSTNTGTIIIHNVLMYKFIMSWIGCDDNKIIPPEAYVAPKLFVAALIDGYVSSAGDIKQSETIELVNTNGKNVCYGIAILLTRFGIMTEITEIKDIPTNSTGPRRYKICLKFEEGIKFMKHIGCSYVDNKNRLETIILAQKESTNALDKPYNPRNDVILDKIKIIKYKKPSRDTVYDLTVPQTLNFGVANGIQQLDTFHLSGVAEKGKVTQGVPRLNEVLKVTKKPKNPSNIIFLRGEERFDRDHAERVKNSIEQTKIGEIIKGDPTFYLEPTNKIQGAIEEDRDFLKFYEVFTELDGALNQTVKNPWIIRMEFDRKEMIYRNITMADVEIVLKMMLPDATIMYSDDNAGKMVFRIRMPFESRENVEDDYKMLRLKANDLKSIIIKGVDLIQKVYINAPTNDCIVSGKGARCNTTKIGDTYEVKDEYSLTTDGANLFDLMMRDDIDATRSYSIDPNEMNRIFGIEAGKFIVEQQFREILASSGAPTSPRHIGLLVNKMAHSGDFMSVDRFGINREDIGPLAKCSFEKTPDLLKDAALFGEVDKLKGISANIMVGQIPECGTGSVKVFLDEVYLVQELKKRGIKPDEPEPVTDVADIFKEFQQKICVGADDQIRMNIQAFDTDNLNISQIPEVLIE